MTGGPVGTLLECLDAIDTVATGADLERSAELRGRLQAGELRVVLVGEAKRGKSTLGNALVGRDLLPSGVTPVTAITTSVRSGPADRAEVHFRDGSVREIALDALAQYVTEAANPKNRLGVRSVEVVVFAGLGHLEGFVLVDTPGVGSLYSHNTEEAHAAHASMDVAVLVLTVDPPISSSELTLFREVSQQAVGVYVVLNKADRLDDTELREALDYVRAAVPEVHADQVFACSAREGLLARVRDDPREYEASGVAVLRRALMHHVTARGEHDLTDSVHRATRRLVERILDQRSTTAAALDALAGNRREDVDAFERSLDAAVDAERAAADLASAEVSRQRQALTEDAHAEVRRQSTMVAAALDALLQRPDEPVARLERDGLDTIERLSRDAVDRWRQHWGERLDEVLRQMTRREQAALEQASQEVRTAARELLGVELLARPGAVPLPDSQRFRYDFEPAAGWNQAQVTAVRRHLPGRARRRVVASYLRGEAETLVDKQVGRARADLQSRLEDAARRLQREIAQEFAELSGTLREAHDVAVRAWEGTVAERGDEARRVADEMDRLHSISERLDKMVPQEPAPADEARPPQRRTG